MRVVRVEVTVRDTHVHVHAGDIRRLDWRLHEEIENHNSLGCKRPPVLGVRQFPNAQDIFPPIPGLISCAGVTRSVGTTRHVLIPQIPKAFSVHIC